MPAAPFDRIATRTLAFTNSDGSQGFVYIDFAAPAIAILDGGAMWSCQFRTRGFVNDLNKTAYGADGVQALTLAMSMAAVMLTSSPAAKVSDWSAHPNFGFPTIPDLPPGFVVPPGIENPGGNEDGSDNGGSGPQLSPLP